MSTYKCQLIVAGDLNINFADSNCSNASRLTDIPTSFECVQRVTGETQIRGGTLDHVITRSSDVISDLYVGPPGLISDHSFITLTLPFSQRHPIAERKALRRWKMVNRNRLKQSILNSELYAMIPQTSTAESLFDTYETVLREISDELAPVKMTTIRRQPIAVWFDDESRLLRRKSRLLERQYRRTGLASDRLLWIQQETTHFEPNTLGSVTFLSTNPVSERTIPRKLLSSRSCRTFSLPLTVVT